MGLRFQRRIRLLPGVRLNLAKSGVGVSVGARGAHVGITSRGQRYWSAGLPGTGLSVREYEHTAKQPAAPCELCERDPQHVHVPGVVVLVCLAAGLFLGLAWWGLWS